MNSPLRDGLENPSTSMSGKLWENDPVPEARESRKTLIKRARRNHSPLFKAKVTADAIRGHKTLAELAKLRDGYAHQIVDGKIRFRTGWSG